METESGTIKISKVNISDLNRGLSGSESELKLRTSDKASTERANIFFKKRVKFKTKSSFKFAIKLIYKIFL